MRSHLPGILFGFLAIYSCALASYDEHEAKIYAQYARVAFCAKSKIVSWSCGEMCHGTLSVPPHVRYFGPGDLWKVQGYVAKLVDETCVLAFRGSVDPMNWVADFRALNRPWPPSDMNTSWCPNCRVHSGFAAAYEELRPEVLLALEDFRCKGLAVSGHSLGGALATLAAAELRATLKIQVAPVYTYGSPRVGNPDFVNAFTGMASKMGYATPQWRVVHNEDPVPLIAPTTTSVRSLSYKHTPLEVYYNENSSAFQICKPTPTGGENPNCSLKTPAWRLMNFDHLTYLNLNFAHKRMSPECTDEGVLMV